MPWGFVRLLSMILVIDNYDSFTYNLVQYLGELGAELSVRRNDKMTVAEIESLAPERIVISPGPRDYEEDRYRDRHCLGKDEPEAAHGSPASIQKSFADLSV